MFNKDELIIYGSTGVCRVQSVEEGDYSGSGKKQLYYVLKPLYQDGLIYTPVSNDKVFMRPVISRDEVHRLISSIPSIKAEAYNNPSTQQLNEHYAQCMRSHSCQDLLELIMSIYCKKQLAEKQKRRFGQVDAKYMKRAEDMLYSEFAVALDIPKDHVQEYIASKLEA